MEELLEMKILECSCYKKHLINLLNHLREEYIPTGRDMPTEKLCDVMHKCFDEIERIKDQRR